ncbi:MAG: sialate O-acetylesterase [Candidatus Sumerlaeota bacterium]|nr:sialate O-acetylesterase [Candidatus Sumerlaeota bacterium]
MTHSTHPKLKGIAFGIVFGILFGIVFAFTGAQAFAALELSTLFCDHMVMQRGMKVPVWGWAEAGEEITVSITQQPKVGEEITVSIAQQTKTGTANAAGKWMVRLDPMETGAPRKMTVKGKTGSREVNDILLGEVWVCSGQSNMAWPLKQAKNGAQEVAGANYPEIRLFDVPNAMAAKGPIERLQNSNPIVAKNFCVWRPCSPDTAKDFSAVAYFFGRDLHQAMHIPVGLISNSVGGSPIVAWISHDALMADPDFKSVAQYYDGLANYVENTPKGKKDLQDRSAEYDAKQAALKAAGKPALWPPKYPGPAQSYGFGCTLFNALTNPLIPYGIRGVVWYQGEAEWQWMYEYRGIFPVLIKDWRNRWGQGDFPFLFVQLPNWSNATPEPDSGGWASIRESQLLTLKLPNTAMAVTIDVGEAASIHPVNKQDVGQRLSLAARAVAYNEKIVYSGPIYRGMKIEGAAIRLTFDHVGSGLMIGKKAALQPAAEDKEGKLKRFAIAGEDMKFVWADAVIDKDTVVVSSPAVPNPVAVRYAWANNPEGCNLYNKEGLPASPFRTDESKPAPPMGAFYKAKLEKPFALSPVK